MEYKVLEADINQSRNIICELWRESFPEMDAPQDKIDSSYINNITKRGNIYLLSVNEKIVGVKGIIPRDCYVYGESKSFGLFCDFTVAKKHRSLGPSIKLLSETVKLASDQYDLLYGFPNKKAEVIFKRVGYEKLPNISRYVKIIDYKPYLKKKIKWPFTYFMTKLLNLGVIIKLSFLQLKLCNQYTSETTNIFKNDIDILWEKCDKSKLIMSARNKEWLEWRFKNSQNSTNIFVINNSKKEVQGYIVYSLSEGVCFIYDALSQNEGEFKKLFILFTKELFKGDTSSISFEFIAPDSYIKIITDLGFIYRDSEPVYAINKSMFKHNNIYITEMDRD